MGLKELQNKGLIMTKREETYYMLAVVVLDVKLKTPNRKWKELYTTKVAPMIEAQFNIDAPTVNYIDKLIRAMEVRHFRGRKAQDSFVVSELLKSYKDLKHEIKLAHSLGLSMQSIYAGYQSIAGYAITNEMIREDSGMAAIALIDTTAYAKFVDAGGSLEPHRNRIYRSVFGATATWTHYPSVEEELDANIAMDI